MKGPSLDTGKDVITYDPSMNGISSAFTSCFNSYLQNTLGWKKNLPYRILSDAISSWDFNAPNQFLNVSENLRRTMTENRKLRVFVASGYYDLVTPFFATEYTFHHLFLPKPIQDHVTFGYYEGGHMMYTNPASLAKMKQDLSNFYKETLAK
jgi:carboxypeptidase C (cathepsin A)